MNNANKIKIQTIFTTLEGRTGMVTIIKTLCQMLFPQLMFVMFGN